MARYSVNWSAQLASTSGSVPIGSCLVDDGTGAHLVATTANRTSYGRCVGIAASAGDITSPVVEMVETGIVPATITGLAAGAVSWVRVSTTGALERVTPGVGDDIVGKARADGSVAFVPGVWDSTNYTSAGGSFTAGGDLTGTSSSQTVARINGIAISGTPAIGNTPGATSTSACVWSALNLAGGANFVSGLLPVANGGTGIGAIATGMATFWATPSGANLAATLTSALPVSKGGTGLTALTIPATGLLVGTTDTQTLTGKTIAGASNTLTVRLASDVTGTLPVANIVPAGTNGFVLKTVAGAVAWAAAGSGSSAGATANQVQTGDGVGGFTAPTNVLAGANFLSIGAVAASVAATGLVRFPYNIGSIAVTLDSGGGDAAMLRGGIDTHFFGSVATTNVCGASGVTLCDNFDTPVLTAKNTGILARYAITGDQGGNSPYSVHGGVIVTPPSNANYTLAASEYAYDWIQLNIGAWIIAHSILLPAPASKAAGFFQYIHNVSTFTATISTGTGTTRTLATALAQRFWVDDTGVRFAGPTFTP